MSNRPAHLDPSELGTREYWDNLYSTELANHAANASDIGTVWFDDSDAEAKTLNFLSHMVDAVGDPLPRDTTSFLDLGCGNGSLLFSLRDYEDDEWKGRMLGVDYSPQSIALAKQVSVTRESEREIRSVPVEFTQWDAISGPLNTVLNGAQASGWDVVLDKGTFDAISLSDEKDSQGRRLCEGYRDRVFQVLRSGGRFVITSCNWTETELAEWFETRGGDDAPGFVAADRVKYPTFSFGGVKGQTISTLCFVKP